jgi:preprotein translocase SecE subunit
MDTLHEQATPSEAARPAPAAPPPRRPSEAGSPLHVYKPGQGVYVRWGSAGFFGLIALAATQFAAQQLQVWSSSQVVTTLGPIVLLAALAWVIFYFCGRNPTTVDFMIATEGEMKKVNWSSRREIIGATRVVIFTTFAMGFLLFVVDVGFILLFSTIGVLKVNVLKAMFGGGQ